MSYDVSLWTISPHGYMGLKWFGLDKSCHWWSFVGVGGEGE